MTDQIKLLKALAKKLKSQKSTKEQSLATLVSAGILNKKGEVTRPYSNLNKLMSKVD